MWQKIKPYVISIAIALGVGGLSALITGNSMNIYEDIVRPPLSPPGILFPIVWTLLYILMGVSAAMIYKSEDALRREALTVYGMSLAVNFIWSPVFFRLRAFLLALVILALLVYLVLSTVLSYRKINKTAAYLQIPYLIWTLFALYLNAGIWYLNT